MRALRLVFSLVLIPRLFAALLLFSLLLSIVVVYFQLLVTGLFIEVKQKDANSVQEHFEEAEQYDLIRAIIYRDGRKRGPIQVCRWLKGESPEGTEAEGPPPGCAPDRLDVALQVEDPSTYDAHAYEKIFNGTFDRLHICRRCSPDTYLTFKNGKVETHSRSIWSVGLVSLLSRTDHLRKTLLKTWKEVERVKNHLGDLLFHVRGFEKPVNLNTFELSVAVVLNIAKLVIVALWLALKAHRRVLDYFARNGALLPLVAATGKNNFYLAIWALTFLRVACFLIASVPLCYAFFSEHAEETGISALIHQNLPTVLLWPPTLIASLGLSTIIASIADLKGRYFLMSVVYRYVPISLCIAGSVVWGGSFLLDGSTANIVRQLITMIPVVGITPVLLAPLFAPPVGILAVHAVSSFILLVMALRRNARWFAAHLEDI